MATACSDLDTTQLGDGVQTGEGTDADAIQPSTTVEPSATFAAAKETAAELNVDLWEVYREGDRARIIGLDATQKRSVEALVHADGRQPASLSIDVRFPEHGTVLVTRAGEIESFGSNYSHRLAEALLTDLKHKLPLAEEASVDGPLGSAELALQSSTDGVKPALTSSERSAGSNEAQSLMMAQAPLVAVADQITKLDLSGDGIGGIQLNVDERTVDVWWKGEPPASLLEIARQQQEGIVVNVQLAKYSQNELKEAAKLIATDREAYPSLSRVGPLVDGSGLEVGLTELRRADAFEFPVPVKVVLAQPIAQTSRSNDSPPWWAGGSTHALPGRNCSTGFAVGTYFLWWQTSRGILTAEHCFFGGNHMFFDGVGEPIGLAAGIPQHSTGPKHSHSLYIYTNSGARTFDGGVGVGEFSKGVADYTHNFPGQFVCTSGAASGAHCNIKIDLINQSAWVAGDFVDGVVLATEMFGNAATGEGDSGGPVFALASDPAKVLAAGMMVGGMAPTNCQIAGQLNCYKKVAYVDILRVMMDQGVSLLIE